MRSAAILVLALGPMVGCRTGDAVRVDTWGTMREVLRDGRSEGRVALRDVLGPRGLVGVGALAGLRGEIAIVDGDAWIARAGDGAVVVERGARAGEQATMLAVADVPAFVVTTIERDLTAAEFDALLAEHAKAPHLTALAAWPFVVDGELRDVDSHVLAGACPFAAQPDPAHAPVRRSFARVQGTLVGFYAPSSGGVLVHHGQATHTHVVVAAPEPWVAHVDRAGVAAGARLRVPAPRNP